MIFCREKLKITKEEEPMESKIYLLSVQTDLNNN